VTEGGRRVKERGNPRLRWLDRYVGVPLLVGLGAIQRRASIPDRIRRLGLLKMTAIGDTVLLSAVVADLVAALPDADLVMFVGRENAGVASTIDGLTEVVVLPTTRPMAVVTEVRRHSLDVMLDCGPWSRLEAVYAALSGARFSAGFRTAGQLRHHCQDASVEHSDRIHELDNYRRLVSILGVPTVAPPRLEPPGLLSAENLPSSPYAVLHPWPTGVRSHLKEWPTERWLELAGRLSTAGMAVVLSGGPADVARSAELARRCGPGVQALVDLAGRLTLTEALDLLAGSACVVSVNTGIMHMAAAVGVPTVGLSGPTSEVRWGPIGDLAVSVNSRFPGCGYLNLGSEYEGQREDCMLGISVDEVDRAVRQIMGRAHLDRSGRMPDAR
jgi:heptosyltransferase III